MGIDSRKNVSLHLTVIGVDLDNQMDENTSNEKVRVIGEEVTDFEYEIVAEKEVDGRGYQGSGDIVFNLKFKHKDMEGDIKDRHIQVKPLRYQENGRINQARRRANITTDSTTLVSRLGYENEILKIEVKIKHKNFSYKIPIMLSHRFGGDYGTQYLNEEEQMVDADTSTNTSKGYASFFRLDNLNRLMGHLEDIIEQGGYDSYTQLANHFKKHSLNEYILKELLKEDTDNDLDIEYNKLLPKLEKYEENRHVNYLSIFKGLNYKYLPESLTNLGIGYDYETFSVEEEYKELVTKMRGDTPRSEILFQENVRVYNLPIKVKVIEVEDSHDLIYDESYRRLPLHEVNEVIKSKLDGFCNILKDTLKQIQDSGGKILDIRSNPSIEYSIRGQRRVDKETNTSIVLVYTEDEEVVNFYSKVLNRDMETHRKLRGSKGVGIDYKKSLSIKTNEGRYVPLSVQNPLLPKILREEYEESMIEGNKDYKKYSNIHLRYSTLLVKQIEEMFSEIDYLNIRQTLNMLGVVESGDTPTKVFQGIKRYSSHYGIHQHECEGLFFKVNEMLNQLDKSLYSMYLDTELKDTRGYKGDYLRKYVRDSYY